MTQGEWKNMGHGTTFKGGSQAVDVTERVSTSGHTHVSLVDKDPEQDLHWVVVQVRREVPINDVVMVRATMALEGIG
jgi:hypothetical protein